MSGFVVWMTGLSGAGKSTLASLLTQELARRGVHVECLDGDEVRKNLSHGLGFSREDRDRNVRRIGYVARMAARSGACAITAAISPYRALRDEIRSRTENFVEVYCECPLDVLTDRDPKGLYKRALAGEIKNFTGVDDPYEAPEDPEVRLRTDRLTPQQCIDTIIETLEKKGLLHLHSQNRAAFPPPFGGEVFEAREVSAEELDSRDLVIQTNETVRQNVLAVSKGYFCPLSGFMTQREAVKVVKSSALESGAPWWPAPFVLPVAGDTNLSEGDVVALREGSQRYATVRVHQVWQDEKGASMVAGPIDSVLASPDTPSAREIRRRARDAGVSWLTLLVAPGLPSEAPSSAYQTAVALSEFIVVATHPGSSAAWRERLKTSGCVISIPEDFPDADERARTVLQKSLGARAALRLVDV